MSKYIPCTASGFMLAGAHVSHIPGYLSSADVLTFDEMRDADILCHTCQGNGMVAA